MGRGLGALISTASSPQDSEEVREIEIDLIRPGQQQPRTSFNEAKLEELAQSIRASGIIQPLLVRRRGGLFELVAGERRWRAAQLAGLSRVPAIVREIADENLLELALIENIQRQELNAVEEANAYKRLIESLGLTQEEIAQRVGRDRTFITNYLRILKLPTEIQTLLSRRSFPSATRAHCLASPIPTCNAGSPSESSRTIGPCAKRNDVSDNCHPAPRKPSRLPRPTPKIRTCERPRQSSGALLERRLGSSLPKRVRREELKLSSTAPRT